ncbi:ParA family protein [Streptomyces sp. NPDC088745]|uniref:ParA family protein n=1 Tax=Streptomyces sp. NPDC088745 TaxID=3365884 RepID=UPI003824803C
MVTPIPSGDREKVVSKLPLWLRQDLKVRTAELGIDIQDAVSEGVNRWRTANDEPEIIDTAGAENFSTYLPPGQWDLLKETCKSRGIPFVQGLSQSVSTWLSAHPSPRVFPTPNAALPNRMVQRIVVCNQKGGVGKTAVAAGLAQALAESPENGGPGKRVLLVDYDPQGHLTKQLGLPKIHRDEPSLAKFMAPGFRLPPEEIKNLITTVEDPRFGGRLDVLPACADAFLLGIMIAPSRNRQGTLELALEPLEEDYDAFVIDSPPSLGVEMDAAIYLARRREGEEEGRSGVIVPVLAEDSSADAYEMLIEQIESGKLDWRIAVDYLGLVVNMYDSRDGYVVTSSLEAWKQLKEPRVLATIGRLKEQREAVRRKQPLLAYAPDCEQSQVMRTIAKELL